MPDQSARLQAARGGAAVGPVLARGLLRLTGKDRLKFLHRVSTQKVDGLPPGAAVHAAFLGVKGHVVADAIVVLRADEALLDVEPAALEPLRTHLVRYVVMDQVKVEDVSAAFRVVPAFGPAGKDLARGRAPAAVAWEDARRGAPALDVLLPVAEAQAFHDGLAAAGATPLSADDLEALRVLAGVARFGADLDGTRLPMEAALVASAVSFEKGCYLGQEVVARGTFRGQIQKGLVQVALPPGTAAGAPLTAGGKEVGVVTSAVETPEGRVGLAYLRRAHWNEGERLALPAGEAVVRRVLVLERE
ncbi:MAG: YgfZ/GcvT domain-containing protein [Anaeromyxobacteraceae bacterium]